LSSNSFKHNYLLLTSTKFFSNYFGSAFCRKSSLDPTILLLRVLLCIIPFYLQYFIG